MKNYLWKKYSTRIEFVQSIEFLVENEMLLYVQIFFSIFFPILCFFLAWWCFSSDSRWILYCLLLLWNVSANTVIYAFEIGEFQDLNSKSIICKKNSLWK